MPLKPVAKGSNMYQGWVTHTHAHLKGQCPHHCRYCYVQALERRFKIGRYTGPVELDEDELDVKYGAGRTIFIEHMGDLWAEGIPPGFIEKVLWHCEEWPDNVYVFQTKNPQMFLSYLNCRGPADVSLPRDALLGTTIESDLFHGAMGDSPHPEKRYEAMQMLKRANRRIFVTVEPIMTFTQTLRDWLCTLQPEFVNIGADSKGGGLSEPHKKDIEWLLEELKSAKIQIRRKTNLSRLLQ